MRRPSLIIVICLLLLTGHAFGEEKPPEPSSCIASARSITLKAGLSYSPPFGLKSFENGGFTLKGLVPDLFANDKFERKKKKEINDFIGNAPIKAYLEGTRKPDRYGRHAAFLARSENGKEILLQDILVSNGLARVMTDNLEANCAHHLLSQERAARSAQKGLWKEAAYSVKKADALHLSAIVSTYQIISGVVSSVHRNEDGTSYMNFGDNWYEDFTIALSRKGLQKWEAQNKFLDDLLSKPIYVRGWVEDRGGPLIELQDASQLIETGNNENRRNAR